MTNIYSWRRTVETTRGVSGTSPSSIMRHIDQESDASVAGSTRPPSELSKPGPAAKTRLSSYINAHKPASSTASDKEDFSKYDWNKLTPPEYDPDVEAMANSLLVYLLGNPARDIPASLQSYMLHVLEDYRRHIDEVKTLRSTLAAEVASHQETLRRLRHANTMLNDDEKERQVLSFKDMETVAAKGKEAIQLLNQSSNRKEVKQYVMKENLHGRSTPQQPSTDNLKFMPRLSPSKVMAYVSRRVITADKRDIMLSSPPPPSTWQSDSNISSSGSYSSSIEIETNKGDDSLPNDNIAIVVRMTHWLAERTQASPKDVFHDIANLFLHEASSIEGQSYQIAQKGLANLPPNNNIITSTRSLLGLDQVYDTSRNALGSPTYRQKQISRFSFVPGDDSRPPPASPSLSAVSKVSLTTVQGTFAHGTDAAPQESHNNLVPPKRDGSGRSTSTTHKEDPQPKRDGSGRSAVTAIKDISSCSSTMSKKNSTSKSGSTTNPENPAQRLRDSALAMAAARAAGERKKLDRSVSSG